MTNVNIIDYSTFTTFYNQIYSARAKLSDRREEAANAGNHALAEKLLVEYLALGERLHEIRRAEVIYLTSAAPNPEASAVNRLRKIVKRGDAALDRLENLTTALDGVADFLSLLRGMIKLM
tara:strand:+ start:234 stop:596 length:363 start_codon:yes stop_codon:yes gene_type:complete